MMDTYQQLSATEFSGALSIACLWLLSLDYRLLETYRLFLLLMLKLEHSAGSQKVGLILTMDR